MVKTGENALEDDEFSSDNDVLVQGAVEMGMADLKVESLMQRYVAMGRTCQMMESVAQEAAEIETANFRMESLAEEAADRRRVIQR